MFKDYIVLCYGPNIIFKKLVSNANNISKTVRNRKKDVPYDFVNHTVKYLNPKCLSL